MNQHSSHFRLYQLYRAMGYPARQAVGEMHYPRTTRLFETPASFVPSFVQADNRLQDARVWQQNGVFYAGCSAVWTGSFLLGFLYVRRGLTAKGAYTNLCRQIRFGLLPTISEEYRMAQLHRQPQWQEIPE